MGRLPAEVREMTPRETADLIEGWNAAQRDAAGEVEPPSLETLDELVARYG